jgi:hypothetical protein
MLTDGTVHIILKEEYNAPQYLGPLQAECQS